MSYNFAFDIGDAGRGLGTAISDVVPVDDVGVVSFLFDTDAASSPGFDPLADFPVTYPADLIVAADNGITPVPATTSVKLFDITLSIDGASVNDTFNVALLNEQVGSVVSQNEIQGDATTLGGASGLPFAPGSVLVGTITAVPEPSTWILGFLLTTGSVVAGVDRWRKRRATQI